MNEDVAVRPCAVPISQIGRDTRFRPRPAIQPKKPETIQCEFLVVLYFCTKDAHLALANLEWAAHLDGQVPYACLMAHDTDVPADTVEAVRKLANAYFREVHEFSHHPPSVSTWPAAPNHAFRECAWHVGQKFRCPWLWWEADAIPIRAGWLDDLWSEYKRGGKPFMGHIVAGMGHMTGVGIYPGKCTRYIPNAIRSQRIAWDVAMKAEMIGQCHRANHLFQHYYNPAPLTFTSWDDVATKVDFRACLIHRCKDSTLIAQIKDHLNNFMPTEENVPAHTADGHFEVPKTVVKGSVQILIVTYIKDIPWLDYCLQAISKFCTGFAGVTVAFPYRDEEAFMRLSRKKGRHFTPYPYVEVIGKGMIQHEERICTADEICPEADFILHMDPDCVFKEPVDVSEYVVEDKPVYVVRTYDSLLQSGSKAISGSAIWRFPVKKALGFDPEMYTMCRHPTCFPRWFYPEFRKHVETATGEKFRDYVLAQKSTFPQGFAEFPAMGAYAWKYFHDNFFWVDISTVGGDGGPRDRLMQYWSRGGISQPVRAGGTAEDEIRRLLGMPQL